MSTIFKKIIDGEIPCHKVAETDNFLAFLDVNPLGEGHTLVVPKQETDYIFDIDDTQLAALHVFAKQVAHAVKTAVPCRKVGMAVIGLEVPHAHIHLVPMNSVDELNFSRPRAKFTADEFAATAARIATAYKS